MTSLADSDVAAPMTAEQREEFEENGFLILRGALSESEVAFYADAIDVFWQDWVLNYNLERQLQLASRVGESSRHIGLNWTDGPRFWSGRNWSNLRNFAFVLLGAIALAFLGKFLRRDGWRWWTTRQRMIKVQRGQGQASDATLLYQRMLKALRRRGFGRPP